MVYEAFRNDFPTVCIMQNTLNSKTEFRSETLLAILSKNFSRSILIYKYIYTYLYTWQRSGYTKFVRNKNIHQKVIKEQKQAFIPL